jgi:NADPH:quinone reductase-like Zn-dependent oxidoreductase
VPLSALTAWQAFFDHAQLSADQRVLIHGAAGGVGLFAVQLAHWIGAHVIGTASARHHELLRALGATEVIDYTTTRFEEVVQDLDLVLDTRGGTTLERSWNVLKTGGTLLSLVQRPSQERAHQLGIHATAFIVKPNGTQLAQLSELIALRVLRPVIEQVFPLSEARQAINGCWVVIPVNFEILWAEFCSLRGRQNEQKGAATVLRLTGRELFPLCWLFLASCDSPA